MSNDVLEKLTLLLEQEQFELVFGEDNIRLVYLMNDAVESFLVFQNVRMTGEYKEDYEGELEASLEKREKEYVLAVHQGDTVITLFFDDLIQEDHFYEYGTVCHFWVPEYEYLRQLEYRIAILRDKYDYLGERSCNEKEQRLAQLADFPPLNYCCYPAVPEKYIVGRDDPWMPSKEAIDVMVQLADEAGDRILKRCLRIYRRLPVPFVAKRIGNMLHRNSHSRVIDLLDRKLQEACSVYPRRHFDQDTEQKYQKTLEKVYIRQKELKEKGQQSVILREEPFTTARDSVNYKIYLMIWQKGILNRKVLIEEYPVSFL